MWLLVLMICMSELTAVLSPPTKWYGHITYIITWPEHLGRWIKANFEKGE